MSSRTKSIMIITISILFLGIFVAAVVLSNSEDLLIIDGDPIADFTDKRNLVGAADYVFLGKVILHQGQVDAHVPITQFQVEVLYEIKGVFMENVIRINQYGGYIKDSDGTTKLQQFIDHPLLKENKIYMFVANKQVDGGILIIPKYGSVEVNNSMHQEMVKNEFIQAYKDQIIPEILLRKQP